MAESAHRPRTPPLVPPGACQPPTRKPEKTLGIYKDVTLPGAPVIMPPGGKKPDKPRRYVKPRILIQPGQCPPRMGRPMPLKARKPVVVPPGSCPPPQGAHEHNYDCKGRCERLRPIFEDFPNPEPDDPKWKTETTWKWHPRPAPCKQFDNPYKKS